MRLIRKIEVYNAWTVQGSKEEPTADFSRPYDWGNPSWHLEKFRLEWQVEEEDQDAFYVNNVFIWTNIQMDRSDYPPFFSTLITNIQIPGLPWQLCGKEFLSPEDIWNSAWGEKPSIFVAPPPTKEPDNE